MMHFYISVIIEKDKEECVILKISFKSEFNLTFINFVSTFYYR